MMSSSSHARPIIGQPKQPKFLIVTGGTVSGLGKGTAISSLGVVLKSHGLKVTSMKIDPYLNVDAGTMSPFEHGEVFVLDDGGEADLDLGNYERFLDVNLESVHSLTSGKIYQKVLQRERAGDFLGKTVQMVPHVTDAIQDWIMDVASKPTDNSGERPDICLIELGGTVGDIESAVYLEALQQLQFKMGPDHFLTVHLGWVPFQNATGEQKTKPCQHSVKTMREAGLKPDLLICRSQEKISSEIRQKLSLFCQVRPNEVISLHDCTNIFRVPMLLAEQKVCSKLGLSKHKTMLSAVLGGVTYHGGADPNTVRLGDWFGLASRVDSLHESLKIGIIGKYTGLTDSYMSVIKALRHAAIEAGVSLEIQWIESTKLEANSAVESQKDYDEAWNLLRGCKGVLVPGGFGNRGIEGMICAAKFCRENKVPYFGICVGLQVATIEACRHILGLSDANSTEFDNTTKDPCVIFMPEHSATQMGGTMRLGSRCTIIKDTNSLASKVYAGQPVIYERHRHRYEVNTNYKPALENHGFIFSGQDERGLRMEIAELRRPGSSLLRPTSSIASLSPSSSIGDGLDNIGSNGVRESTTLEENEHPFFLAVQFHPEFKSRPNRPSPVFLAFVLACCGKLDQRIEEGNGRLVVGAGFQKKIEENCKKSSNCCDSNDEIEKHVGA